MIWQPGQLHAAQGDAVEELGFKHSFFRFDEKIPNGTDIILVQGPYGTLFPLVEQLVEMPADVRPVLAYWFGESLQFLRPDPITRGAAFLASDLTPLSFTKLLRLPPKRASAFTRPRPGHRLRFLGDIRWLHRQRLLDVLALSSTVYADYLLKLGIDSIVVQRGYYPGYGRWLNLERDIALLWMGKPRTKRRQGLIDWLRQQVESSGHVMHVYDGIKRDFIFGEQRTALLNRSLFVLNLNSYGSTDELSIRYYIAAANGAVILREPNDNHYPFIPGEHLVECHPHEMPEQIRYYIDHPEERQRIADNMFRLISSELTLSRSIQTILEKASVIWRQRKKGG